MSVGGLVASLLKPVRWQ